MTLTKAFIPLYAIAAFSGISISTVLMDVGEDVFGNAPRMIPAQEPMFNVTRLDLTRDGTLLLEREVYVEGWARWYLSVETDRGAVICAGGGIAHFTITEDRLKKWPMTNRVATCPDTFEAGTKIAGAWEPLDPALGVLSKEGVVK